MEPRDALFYSYFIGFYPHILGKSQIRGSKEKMVPVSAFPDDYILYITMENFKRYEDGLLDVEVLELRENAGAVEMFARNKENV